VVNPATEERLAEVAWAGRADIQRAFDAAARAMPAWAKLTAYDRAKILKKTADLMRERITAGADVSCYDEQHGSALFVAISARHLVAMDLLISSGADLHRTDLHGQGALDEIRRQ
jgi:acyl-CoA reductase-like NAD-dependent aldehyde dehydrogenase